MAVRLSTKALDSRLKEVLKEAEQQQQLHATQIKPVGPGVGEAVASGNVGHHFVSLCTGEAKLTVLIL